MTDTKPKAPTADGATVRPLYVERKMRVYAIHEHEVDSLSTLNAQATTFYAVASFLLSGALGIWIQATFSPDPIPPMAALTKLVVAPASLALAIVFFLLGRNAAKKRASTWSKIKEESERSSV